MSKNTFDYLRDRLVSGDWPKATDAICDPDSEADKSNRAKDILSLYIEKPVEGKKILDYGCGEGHLTRMAAEFRAIRAVGYDIVAANWPAATDKYTFSTNFKEVAAEGPYDLVILYDVLDHAVNPVEQLNKARSVLANDGLMFVHCHPWISRHGGHYFQVINKAFVHLVFTQDEMRRMNYGPTSDVNRVLTPIKTYEDWFKKANLRIRSYKLGKTHVESIFEKDEIIRARLPVVSANRFPRFQMEQSFHDYSLGI